MSAPDYERLVDPRFGLITHVRRSPVPPELPVAFVEYGAEVADTSRLGDWQGDRIALGAAFYDAEGARLAAIGEALERYCGNFVPAGLRRASWRELAAAGEDAVDPAALVLYSDAQYAARGFPFRPFTADLPVRWAPGRDLASGAPVWAPASLVYINYFTGPHAGAPLTNFVNYAGIACGPTREAAERAALEELIERDATTIWWLSGSPAPGVALDDLPLARAALATRGGGGAIGYHLIWLRTPFDVPVIGALIVDRDLGIVGLGFACRPDPTAAALKALVEAVHLRVFAQGFLDPDGHVWRAIRAGIFDPRAYKPFRADRAYLDAFRPDFRDVTDLGAQTQLYLDPRMHAQVAPIVDPPERIPATALPTAAGPDPRAVYLARLAARGFRAISVDVTTPDVRAAGLHVARVLVPGLYSNAPAAFPPLGGRRLYEEPAALGWLPAPLTEGQIRRVPLPHT